MTVHTEILAKPSQLPLLLYVYHKLDMKKFHCYLQDKIFRYLVTNFRNKISSLNQTGNQMIHVIPTI